jgi:hypothetical protein
MNEVIAVVGNTGAVAPTGCEFAEVRLIDNPREPVEVVMGCIDFKLSLIEAVALGRLLVKAGGAA